MSQAIFGTIVPSTTSGNQLAQYLNDFKEAIVSSLSGTSRPTELDAGGTWLDITADPIWVLYMFDGVQDIPLFTINTTTGVAGSSNAADTFEIVKTSADSVSPILTLLKERIANNGQVLSGDFVGTMQMKGNADDLSVPITIRIRGQATENYTSSTGGTDLIIETTTQGSVALAEIMRFKSNGNVGVGTAAPLNKLHVAGDGIRSSLAADNTVGAKFITHKARVAGTGQVQSGDIIAAHEYKSQSATTIVDAAKIEVSATENHTDAAIGAAWELFIKKIGSAAFTSKIFVGEEIILKELLRLTQQVDAATTGSGQSLTPTNTILKVTNASLASINNIVPKDSQVLILMNGTGVPVTVIENSGGTAANRIITGTGANLSLANNASLWLAYDVNSTRWRVIGGSGSGGGSSTIETTITGDISLTEDPASKNRTWLIDASAGNITVTLPAASATTIGSNFRFKRIDAGEEVNGFTVTIVRNGADTIDEGNSQTLPNQWSRMGIVGLTATAWGVF